LSVCSVQQRTAISWSHHDYLFSIGLFSIGLFSIGLFSIGPGRRSVLDQAGRAVT
jgi:hypothetical protein